MNPIITALMHRKALLENGLRTESAIESDGSISPFGENVKMINHRTLKPTLLTSAEKDDVVVKYESGMTMTAIANIYRCHYTTIGRILKSRDVVIRSRTE